MRERVRFAGRSALLGLIALVVVLGGVRSALALTVTSLAIIAKNDHTGMDRRIPPAVQAALRRAFRGTYDSFHLHSAHRRRVKMKGTAHIPLPGDYELTVQPLKARGRGRSRRILLKVLILREDQPIIGAAVWIRPGRYWLLGGPAAEGGDLVVALAVSE